MRTVDRSSRIAGVLAVFGGLIVIGAVVLGWLTVRAIGERALARADADAARERAEALANAVRQATDELRVQEAKLRQAQKMDAVGQLTGGIAHDFNNMLAVVLGGLELARRSLVGDPDAAARHLDNAADGANRAAALTRRLLAFSREESLKPEPIAVAQLVSGMSELIDRTLGDGITVTTRDSAGGWQVRADRVQLENAILNLAVNARDAMHGRGELAIATGAVTLDEHQVDHCAAGDYVTIAVADTGEGMTPEVVERVYEPFFTTKAAGRARAGPQPDLRARAAAGRRDRDRHRAGRRHHRDAVPAARPAAAAGRGDRRGRDPAGTGRRAGGPPRAGRRDDRAC